MDSREHSKVPKIAEALKEAGADLLVERLPGDYHIPADPRGYLVERKTALDLVSSVRTRRLWGQLELMKRAENTEPILLVENPLTLIQKFTKWNPSSVCGILSSIELEWGVPVLWAPNRSWTVAYLLSLAHDVERAPRVYPLRIVQKDRPLWEIQRGVLEGIPGVSSTRAVELLQNFKTIRRLANASVDELLQVKGIGTSTADKICKILTEEFG